MTTFFGQSELEKLRDLDYKTESHTFSKGVIAAYYNGMEYPMTIEPDYNICIKRRKGKVFWELNPSLIRFETVGENDTVYSIQKSDLCKVKTKEVIYNLDEIFTNPSKQVRRAIELTRRENITCGNITNTNIKFVNQIYEEWTEHKMADPKVFRIAFTPKRYIRSFSLSDLGFSIFDQIYFIDGEPYASICFEVSGQIAFELAFISRFWRKDLKICNDLNELILIDSFHELWKSGVKRVNVGPTAGIKGLKTFKNKLPHTYHEIYSN